MKVLVAITGASGVIYGIRLIEVLREKGIETYCIISNAGQRVIKEEYGEIDFEFFREDDYDIPFISGSQRLDAMVIIPCSMKTLATIANGISLNNISRIADVMLKERRKLIIVPRETPLNIIHLENMLKLAKAGAIILPAMPGFYHKPKTLEDIIDFIVGKVLDILNIEHDLYKRWKENPKNY